MKDLTADIVELIKDQMGSYRKKLNYSTRLELDLGITGDDAVELLLEYQKRFNVDLSHFNITQYFAPEGDSILPFLIRFFTGKQDPKKYDLTIGDLVNGNRSGKLDPQSPEITS